jgi:hypothetical protein
LSKQTIYENFSALEHGVQLEKSFRWKGFIIMKALAAAFAALKVLAARRASGAAAPWRPSVIASTCRMPRPNRARQDNAAARFAIVFVIAVHRPDEIATIGGLS